MNIKRFRQISFALFTIILFLAFAVSAIKAQVWTAFVLVENFDSLHPQIKNVTFGVYPNATDGFDDGLDETTIFPPAPAPGQPYLNVGFKGPGLSYLSTDIRPLGPWTLIIGSSGNFRVTWDISSVPADVPLAIESSDGRTVDMKTITSMNFPEKGSYSLIIDNSSGTVAIDIHGPPTWSYILTWNSGALSQWSYTGAGITDANVTGSAAGAGWRVLSQTATQVIFTTEAPLTLGSLNGFEITGNSGGMGRWKCHVNSGSIEGALPVELSSFTATISNDGVMLRWRTESEINNLGFNIYRSERKNGEYIKVNPARIKGLGTNATPHNYQFVDETVEDDKTYYYYLQDVDFHGKVYKSDLIRVTISHQTQSLEKSQPLSSALFQNYPNPFNRETWLPYQLATDATVIIMIYNQKGQVIRTISLGTKPAGVYIAKDKAAYWDGRDSLGKKVASGVYFYTLQVEHSEIPSLGTGGFSATRKMVILK